MELKINPLFRDKIPPLTQDEIKRLEENILADGEVLEPLIVWHDTIVDGHNRWAIIQKHPELKYSIKEMEFIDEYAAIVWMCRNQLGRRNITDAQRDYLISQEYDAQSKTKGGQEGNQNAKKRMDENRPFVSGRARTRQLIADNHGMTAGAVQTAVEFGRGLDEAEKVSPGIKDAVLSGTVKVPKNVVSEIRRLPEKEKKEVAEAIKSGNVDDARDVIKTVKKEKGKFELAYSTHPKNHTNDEIIEQAVKNLYDTKDEDRQTVDDLLEDLRTIVNDFSSKVKRSLQIYSTTYQEKADRNRVYNELVNAENAINKLKELVK